MDAWHHIVELFNAPYEWVRGVLIGVAIWISERLLRRWARQFVARLSRLRPRRTYPVGSSLVMPYKILGRVSSSGVGAAQADDLGGHATDGGTVYLKLTPEGSA